MRPDTVTTIVNALTARGMISRAGCRSAVPPGSRIAVFLVFGGFVIGWASATIARYVYPPPKRCRQDTGKSA